MKRGMRSVPRHRPSTAVPETSRSWVDTTRRRSADAMTLTRRRPARASVACTRTTTPFAVRRVLSDVVERRSEASRGAARSATEATSRTGLPGTSSEPAPYER